MLKKCLLSPAQLNKRVNLNRLKFETTAEVPFLSSVIGQERAVSSINFALEMDKSGYNVFVSGHYGSGRTTIVMDLLKNAAKTGATPPDCIFVYNFETPDEPAALLLPPGEANKFKERLKKLIYSLHKELRKTFESKNYDRQKSELIESVQTTKQRLLHELENEARAVDIQIQSSNIGFITVPFKDGKPLTSEDFQKLSPEEQQNINKNISHIQKRIQEVLRQLNILDRDLHDKLEELNQEVARFVVDNHFAHLREKYEQFPEIQNYLNQAAEDIIRNVAEFIGKQENGHAQELAPAPLKVDKYKVNVVIDNSKQKGVPVIYETNPTYVNLFGRIEKKAYQGFVYTDYTLIKAGSLLSSNGGYLVLDAEQLLKHPFAYEALKRTLRSGYLRIEDFSELLGVATTTALRPQPIPVKVKVILIGQARLYRLLHNYDEEFRKIFKVRADFDVEVKETPKTINQYVQFISRVVYEENLLHFDREGVSAIIEYAFRLADHQKKLSIRFGELVKIIRESSFWAKQKKHKLVSGKDVEYAIENLIYRHNLIEEKVHDAINERTINIDVSGFKVGQINGLAVYDLGDHAFGRPSRITINTYIGSRGIINIEREAKLSGKIHDKGILILTGYFYQKFGQNMPLSFSASITFEQSYSGIDGDSASSAELYGLISSLSDVPVNQGIAVTGSVNQKGEVQAIGGVNEKIEGFFKVCKAKGLTGDQGVIIPKANVKNLLLKSEIIQAVKENKFHIWAVDNIEDGLYILTGQKCGLRHKDGSYTKNSIFERVRLKLVEFAKQTQIFRRQIGEMSKKENEESSDD
ncbi:MAG: AAA family ATPase [Calditrichaeota bacterium]|nr:AAA family ATPase [Calditrichota bacterium]